MQMKTKLKYWTNVKKYNFISQKKKEKKKSVCVWELFGWCLCAHAYGSSCV